MRVFNRLEDSKINELALACQEGGYQALEEFMEFVQPKLKSYAKKFSRTADVEDIEQEFYIVAIKMVKEFANRYNNGYNNIMGLIYTACKNKLIDMGRYNNAEQRASQIIVGDDIIVRECSLQAKVGAEGTLCDHVPDDDIKSIESEIESNKNRVALKMVVDEFVSSTKGRNALIVKVLYSSFMHDWESAKTNTEIARILQDETGKKPTEVSIRQAKSRGFKALKSAILDGKLPSAMNLEWDF